jgi:F0F1-type ATP synthase assembly protein I
MQGKTPSDNHGRKTATDVSSKVLALTIADTTWRMFVPTLGCTILGIWLDGKLGMRPWLMFAGIIVGFAMAIYAVRLQMKRIKN